MLVVSQKVFSSYLLYMLSSYTSSLAEGALSYRGQRANSESHTTTYVFSYSYICVTVLLHMCPHPAVYVSSYCYICVLILLYMCRHTGVLSYRGHRAKSECAGGPHTASQNPRAHVADVPRGRPFWWWWHGYWRRYDAGIKALLKAPLRVYQCRRRAVGEPE